MSKGIEISPKHGLNPTIPVCFWCGKEKNEIALLGRIREKETRKTAWGGQTTSVRNNDVQAPPRMVIDYEPCDECKKMWESGVAVLEAQETPTMPNQPEIQKGIYPTGRLVVVTVEGADRVFPQHAPWSKGQKVFVDVAVFSHFLPEDPSPDIPQ